MTVIYGIANCDKCRSAIKWFAQSGLEYRFHDLRKDGLSAELLASWLATAGADQLLNKRSTTWRQLSASQREQAAGPSGSKLILQHPTLLKRPLIAANGQLLVGYDESSWQALLA